MFDERGLDISGTAGAALPFPGVAAGGTLGGLPDPLKRIAFSLLGGFAVAAIGVLDSLTGELRLSVLYVVVIAVMTWINGRNSGLVFAAASGVAILLANTAAGNQSLSDPLFLESTVSDLLVFGFCVVGTNSLRDGLGRERARRRNLARYVPAPFGERLADEGLDALKSRAGSATIVFIDIRGFTALSHDLPPAEIFDLLQAYRRIVLSAVKRYGGFVDKFIGDGALAVFGFGEAPNESADRAVAAALDILARIDGPVDGLRAGGRPLRVGIGIHAGDVIVGAIGDDERLEFTVLGDTVNVAARIEDLTRDLGLPLLASAQVHAALPAELRRAYTWARVCVPAVRGLSEPLELVYPDPSPIPAGTSFESRAKPV